MNVFTIAGTNIDDSNSNTINMTIPAIRYLRLKMIICRKFNSLRTISNCVTAMADSANTEAMAAPIEAHA